MSNASKQQSVEFISLLENLSRTNSGIGEIARFLKSCSLSLDELGIAFHGNHKTSFITPEWKQLQRCVLHGAENEALTIFKAMACHLTGYGLLDCVSLMRDVLQRPWRVRAIEEAPRFFLKTRKEPVDRLLLDHQKAANAFQTFASVGAEVQFSREEVGLVLSALKAIGVVDAPNPEDQGLSLHMAASVHGPAALSSFVEAFPQHIHSRTKRKLMPLHYAAMSWHPENIGVLIDAGADPRSQSKQNTPMRLAAKVGRMESVMRLIDTKAYSDDEVVNAAREFTLSGKAEIILAYHAAGKARCAIEQFSAHEGNLTRPL